MPAVNDETTTDPFVVRYVYRCAKCGYGSQVFFSGRSRNGDTVPCDSCGTNVSVSRDWAVIRRYAKDIDRLAEYVDEQVNDLKQALPVAAIQEIADLARRINELANSVKGVGSTDG
ncbi:hypothetical protein [Burkholderia lata]|uniref:hypothetical protein n=1 Tax=Burkholderia lata (strain ATCC 17760 / DSM 23089 / LMG 22485 / NCIMB 9086 / R18194 / 383) TaxID=482957 RepID=UPI0015817E86|nr:hypothetical protein [Burkholderia lata]